MGKRVPITPPPPYGTLEEWEPLDFENEDRMMRWSFVHIVLGVGSCMLFEIAFPLPGLLIVSYAVSYGIGAFMHVRSMAG